MFPIRAAQVRSGTEKLANPCGMHVPQPHGNALAIKLPKEPSQSCLSSIYFNAFEDKKSPVCTLTQAYLRLEEFRSFYHALLLTGLPCCFSFVVTITTLQETPDERQVNVLISEGYLYLGSLLLIEN